MKKIPLIGLLLGAVAAMFAMKKSKQHNHGDEPAADDSGSPE